MRSKKWLWLVLLFHVMSFSPKPNIHIVGITNSEMLQNANAFISVSNSPFTGDVELWAKQISETIQQSLLPFGYFKNEVRYQIYPQCVKFIVTPHELCYVKTLKIHFIDANQEDISEEAFCQQMMAKLPLKINEPALTKTYQMTKNMLLFELTRLGYLNATLERHVIEITDQGAHVYLTVNCGQKYTIKNISLHTTPKKMPMLKKFLSIKTGDDYRIDTILKNQTDLQNTRYFHHIMMTEQKNNDHTVSLAIEATPAPVTVFNLRGVFPDMKTQAQLLFNDPYIQLSCLTTIDFLHPENIFFEPTASLPLYHQTIQRMNLFYRYPKKYAELNAEMQNWKPYLHRYQEHDWGVGLKYHTAMKDDFSFFNTSNKGAFVFEIGKEGFKEFSLQAIIDKEMSPQYHLLVYGEGNYNIQPISLGQSQINDYVNIFKPRIRGLSKKSREIPGHFVCTGTIELEKIIQRNKYISLFSDLGWVKNQEKTKHFCSMGIEYGLRTPVGPFGIGLSYCYNDDDRGHPWPYIRFGVSFGYN